MVGPMGPMSPMFPPRSGSLGASQTAMPFTPQHTAAATSGTPPQLSPLPTESSNFPFSAHAAFPPANPAEPTEFYREATAAFSPPEHLGPAQSEQSRPQAYPYQPEPYYGQERYPPVSDLQRAPYERGPQGTVASPQRGQQRGLIILIACVCLVIVLISTTVITAFTVSHVFNESQPSPQREPAPAPSPTVGVMPTLVPSPTEVTTALPTPLADAGFQWCGAVCATYGFSTEYLGTWQVGGAANAGGVQFTNALLPSEYASFKALGVTQVNADGLVSSDLATNYASKSGYVPPTTRSTNTISGETWITAVAFYPNELQQKMRVQVYGTVHQGKAYIIELQAPDDQFDAVNTQAFMNMLARFQFLQAP